MLGGDAAELAQKSRGDADGDELFGVAGDRAADPACATQLGGTRFRDLREVQLAIRHRLCVLYASLDER